MPAIKTTTSRILSRSAKTVQITTETELSTLQIRDVETILKTMTNQPEQHSAKIISITTVMAPQIYKTIAVLVTTQKTTKRILFQSVRTVSITTETRSLMELILHVRPRNTTMKVRLQRNAKTASTTILMVPLT